MEFMKELRIAVAVDNLSVTPCAVTSASLAPTPGCFKKRCDCHRLFEILQACKKILANK